MSNRMFAGYWALGTVGLILLVLVILAVGAIIRDPPAPPPAPRSNQATYVVAEGDSLASISEQTAVPVEQIETLNPKLDPLALMPGDRVRLRQPTAAERRREAADRARRPRVYVVRPEEGLLAIQERTGVEVARLRKLNPKQDLDKLTPGMRLRLIPPARGGRGGRR